MSLPVCTYLIVLARQSLQVYFPYPTKCLVYVNSEKLEHPKGNTFLCVVESDLIATINKALFLCFPLNSSCFSSLSVLYFQILSPLHAGVHLGINRRGGGKIELSLSQGGHNFHT